MSQKVASLYAEIGANTNGFTQGAAGVKSSLVGLASKFITTTAVVTALTEAFRFSITQAAESQSVNAKLTAVLNSTGGAAGMTAKELDDMATSLSRMSTFDDEAIKGSEALLLTFTKIGRDVFPQAEQAILNVATLMGGDLQSATIQVGKALNDPIAGLGALTRVGIQFTDAQKSMIKTLVESGDTMGAQKVILSELTRQFGGQALAASKTYTGQMAQLKNEVGNLGEAIGTELMPDLMDFVKTAKIGVIWVTENYQAIKKWGNAILWLTNPLMQISKIGGKWLRDLVGVTSTNDELGKSAEGTGGALADEAGALGDLIDPATAAKEALQKLSDANLDYLSNVFSYAGAEENYRANQKDQIQQIADAQDNLTEAVHKYGSSSKEALDATTELDNAKQGLTDLETQWSKTTSKMVYDMIQARVMSDGILSDIEAKALVSFGLQSGLFTEAQAAQTQGLYNLANTYLETLGLGDDAERDKQAAVDTTRSVIENASTVQANAISGVTLVTYQEIEAQRLLASSVYATAAAYSSMGYSGISESGNYTGVSGGKRDSGGPGVAGTPYQIGVPEIFVPKTGGDFIPLGGASAKNIGTTYNITVINPKRETAEDSIRKSLKTASYSGSFA